jgi:hypothetical protein
MSTPERYRMVREDGTPIDLDDLGGVSPEVNLLGLAYQLDPLVATVATSDPAGAPLTRTVRWPDGAAGAFTITRDAASSVSGYVVTHVLAGTTSTFTQPTITRDANGAVTSRPAITVS